MTGSDAVKVREDGLRWGYALPWYGPFMMLDENPLYAKLKFLHQYNLKSTHIGMDEISALNEAEQEVLGRFLEDHDLEVFPHIRIPHMGVSADEVKRAQESAITFLFKYKKIMRNRITHTGANAGHRFDRSAPVGAKMESLSRALAPVAVACEEMGIPLVIENHGDFYVSEYIDLIKQTPHLYMFLDTGNTYLLGEKPLPAFELAAPYTLGTHFKDHRVSPQYEARPLHFEVAGSAIGEGDVPLRECYDLLMKHAPNPKNLVMVMEMICPDHLDPVDCIERSIRFVNSLGRDEYVK